MIALLALVLGAPPLLAPSVHDLDRSLDRVARLLDRAEEADGRWSLAQRAFVSLGCPSWRCASDEGRPVAARLDSAAVDHHRATQGARAEWARAQRILGFEAVRPLLGPGRRDRAESLEARLLTLSRRYVARLAWNARFADRWADVHRREPDQR